MNRYGIEDIGNAVKESTICPFMLERECSTLAENDCVRCVKGWFADHDEQIREDAIDERASLLAYICKKYSIPIMDMNQTVEEWEELKEQK